MIVPASPFSTALDLTAAFNTNREDLGGGLALRQGEVPDWSAATFGDQTFRGMPFRLGERGRYNVICLDPEQPAPVSIGCAGLEASYFVFLHAVADRETEVPPGFGRVGAIQSEGSADGNALGGRVSIYRIVYEDGAVEEVPILRRFAIQQRHIPWSASAFLAIPARGPHVFASTSEDIALGRSPQLSWGSAETRHESGRVMNGENLWLYAMPNPHPQRPIASVTLEAAGEPSVVYGVAVTRLVDHPLRPTLRRRLRLELPAGTSLNAFGELDADDRGEEIGIDLGTVISARAVLDYPAEQWGDRLPEVQPVQSSSAVIVDYVAHPAAKLYVATSDGPLSYRLDGSNLPDVSAALQVREIAAADRLVRFRIVDGASGAPVAVRLHVHGPEGEYLPPRGHHRKVNPSWFEDNYAELVSGYNQYAYVEGDCIVDLPLGRVSVEISCGFEYMPVRTSVQIGPQSEELSFKLDRVFNWRQRGWITADTHVHFISPQTALLEGRAEGVNVVNLLAAQWGEMYSNVGDFDGATTLSASNLGGTGEFLVRVGTENRMQVLGHISLLGYSGPMIHPLSTGGPAESAIGDPLEVSMAVWAEMCRRQGGLVVMPHAPNPQAERAADIVLGLVDAIEMMTFNPRSAQVNPHGLADWYRYLNIGMQLPLVAGSDKMSAASVLGGIRTYARLADAEFSYGAWQRAVRQGDTFVTVGPLVEMTVDGYRPGQTIHMPPNGGSVVVEWLVESVSIPVESVEIVVGGLVSETIDVGALSTRGSATIRLVGSSWIALRIRGSYGGRKEDIAAHTSAVHVVVGGAPVLVQADANAVLEQIEGTLAFVDTLAPMKTIQHFRQVRAALEAAHRELHARMHRAGLQHQHAALYGHPSDH